MSKDKKRYVVSVGRRVNSHASKTGVKYYYQCRTDDPDTWIKKNEKWDEFIRIKDSLTNEIYYLKEGEHNVQATD